MEKHRLSYIFIISRRADIVPCITFLLLQYLNPFKRVVQMTEIDEPGEEIIQYLIHPLEICCLFVLYYFVLLHWYSHCQDCR